MSAWRGRLGSESSPVPAQVHVELTAGGAAARLLPDEALEVAVVRGHGVDVVPLVPDRADQRVGKPAGAVDRRLDAVGEVLPGGQVRAHELRLAAGAASAFFASEEQPEATRPQAQAAAITARRAFTPGMVDGPSVASDWVYTL